MPRVPGVLPRQHHHHQRLRPSRPGPLPGGHREAAARPRHDRGAAHHAVERRGADLRDRRREAGLHGGVGPGGRGHRLQLHRRRAGLRQRDLVRHGRHHGQGRPDPGRPAQDHQGVRGRRAGQPGGRPGAGQRLSHQDPGHRSGRDRRRRRQHRLGRFGRHPARGTAERGRRSGTDLLRAGWRGAHHHGRQSGARPARPRVLPGWGDGAQRRCRPGRYRPALRRAHAARPRGLRQRHRRDRQCRDDECAAGDDRAARLRPETWSWWRSEAPDRCMPTASARR